MKVIIEFQEKNEVFSDYYEDYRLAMERKK
jgi:hypothetical protein